MTPSVDAKTPTYWGQLWNSVQAGAKTMAVQFPLTASLNRISTVSCSENVGMFKAIDLVGSGALDKKTPNIRHFFKGGLFHFLKEGGRLGFKPGMLFFKGDIDEHFGVTSKSSLFSSETVKANTVFSALISLPEGLVQIPDSARVMWQAGMPIRESIPEGIHPLRHLSRGAWGNIGRQALTWFPYPYANHITVQWLRDFTDVEPNSMQGIAARTYPSAFMINACAWLFERLKTQLQIEPQLTEEAIKQGISRYLRAAERIYEIQGTRGFTRGFVAKTHYIAVLYFGAEYVRLLRFNSEQSQQKH